MNIGIDLGTTNSALAWINPAEADDLSFPPIHVFDVPQLVAPHRIEPRRTLPSFLLLEEGQPVGAYAREQGALLPTKLVHSAKSWLSNSQVDRTAKILPWDSQEAARSLSPVEVSARYLAKFREEWDKSGKPDLASQNIVLTVPASFDEEGRELTVEAARQAGLPQLTLIEEPAAAFYSWIAGNLTQSRKRLFDGQTVLICDVGGGTSDFSLIRVGRENDRIEFTRTAVGRHLLLGGDNLDLTLGWLVENKLGVALSLRQRSGLRRQCSSAKERLLSDPKLASVEITVLGSGSSLVGKTMKTEILREEALELTLEGFLPITERAARPQDEKRSLFRELGLPYETDPAITKHLAAFLDTAGQIPDAILFNGGFFIPEICRERVADALEHWYGKRPEIFDNRDLDLAVARGAAYYSYVRSTGSGVIVRGGLPRAYFIGLSDESAVCLVPRGAEEGTTLEVDRDDLHVVANRPVSFALYSSLARSEDAPGQLVPIEPEFRRHSPLQAVLRFGKQGEREVPVRLGARLTEIGTLETWCQSKISEHRWRLQFELRKGTPDGPVAPSRPAAIVSEEAVKSAAALVQSVFSATSTVAPEELPARLEQLLGLGRNSWPVAAARELADAFLTVVDGRRFSPAYEVRWLNLCGFCLRPGFGFPGDEYRVEQARRVYSGGLQFANQAQNEIDWWIFWGRLAGGMNRNQQVDIFQRLSGVLLPRRNEKRQRINSSLMREMWRTASSLELLPAGTRTELGDAILRNAKAGQFSSNDFWCLSRLAARQLFYGPANQVLPAATAARWVEALLKVPGAEEALASIARHTGDPVRDLPPAVFDAVRTKLTDERHLAILEGDESPDERAMGRIFGESLPSGLRLTIGNP
jgi:molecular chaperone DnaK (HSP70)